MTKFVEIDPPTVRHSEAAWLQALRATRRFGERLVTAEELQARSRRAFLAAGGDRVLAMDVNMRP